VVEHISTLVVNFVVNIDNIDIGHDNAHVEEMEEATYQMPPLS